jgi:pyruvate kinase
MSNHGARTKIVATIGPASADPDHLDALLDAGIDVARVNCAHGTHESLRQYVETIRERADRKDRPLSILADLGGPKLRIGSFADGSVVLEKGERFVLTTDDVAGAAARVSVNHPALPADVRKDHRVYLNDGLISLIVTEVEGNEVRTRVEVGGELSDHKGLSVPGSDITTPSVTEKDWNDLELLAQLGVDSVGLSFVRKAADVEVLRDGMRKLGMEAPIVAKIEKEQAVAALDEIIRTADAIMVARGDLGVECPLHDVAILQKKIIRACKLAGVPVITATQMLESMTANPRPTRAEATDVANAVLDGTDAVMLSGETATGKYPVEAVEVMRRIIVSSEGYAVSSEGHAETPPLAQSSDATPGEAVGRSACTAAESLDAQAIVCMTQTGASARYIAKWRPRRPLIAVTPSRTAWRRLNLVWGVEPVLTDEFGDDFDASCAHILKRLREQSRLVPKQPVVITAGLPFSKRGRTNTIRIESP